MAFFKEGGAEDAQECPVCYEPLPGSERTLSCGHAFCHDCLVKTLVSINSDGHIRDTIACPICRHLTFIRRQKEALVSLAAKKGPSEGQTLEVPVPLGPGQVQSARRASVDSFMSGVNWIVRCCRCGFQRLRAGRLIGPSHNNACQIFIISAQGRPMAEEDALDVVMTVVQPQRRTRRRVCTTARCLIFLLTAFTLLALVAATLPWILLA
ncbi:RING finger protein 222 [Kryptolebias marmoratus]|nr:RING finger protein 222 [Kryptolebias marmoratus]